MHVAVPAWTYMDTTLRTITIQDVVSLVKHQQWSNYTEKNKTKNKTKKHTAQHMCFWVPYYYYFNC